MPFHRSSLLACVVPFVVAGCVGGVGNGGGAEGGDDQAKGGGAVKGGGGTGAEVGGAGAIPFVATMQRLTQAQIRNVVTDVFGEGIVVPDLEADSPVAGFDEVGASKISTSARGVELYEAAATSVARQVFEDQSRRAAILGCVPKAVSAPDETCARKFLADTGRRLFRRPLNDAEVERYLAIAAVGAQATQDFHRGMELMLSALLQSPLFLYRSERGVAMKEVERYRSYDMASRLSFALVDSAPDEGLLDAAAAGELDHEAGVVKHAKRLLASERAQQNIENFFTKMLHLPSGATPTAQAMKQETLLVLRELSAQRLPYTDLFVAPFTFVNDTLAQLYDLPERPGTEMKKVMLPSSGVRRGLLGHAGILVESGTDASPILRGKFVREALLCQIIPAPPPDAMLELPAPEEGKLQTMRERLAQHRDDAACSSCHQLMDPIGLALENFEGNGRYRKEYPGGRAIDASGELDGVDFDDALGLGEALAKHPQASECLVASLQRRMTGHFESAAQTEIISQLAAEMIAKQQSVNDLVLNIVKAETFNSALPPQ